MSSIKKSLCSATARRGIISIIVFTVVWEICTRLHVPIIGNVLSLIHISEPTRH